MEQNKNIDETEQIKNIGEVKYSINGTFYTNQTLKTVLNYESNY